MKEQRCKKSIVVGADRIETAKRRAAKLGWELDGLSVFNAQALWRPREAVLRFSKQAKGESQ